MSFRLPSLGFLYLIGTGLLAVWTINFINRPMFYEEPWGSVERDLGEARYLARMAAKATPAQRKEWLPEALSLALQHADMELANRILALLNEAGVSDQAAGLVEIYPGVVWAFGLTDDGWTTGSKRGGLLLRNPDSNPHKVALTFSDGGFSGEGRTAMECIVGKERSHLQLRVKVGAENHASIETPEVARGNVLVVTFRGYRGTTHDGRDLGMRFVGAELVK